MKDLRVRSDSQIKLNALAAQYAGFWSRSSFLHCISSGIVFTVAKHLFCISGYDPSSVASSGGSL